MIMPFDLRLDLEKTGLDMFFKPYMVEGLKVIRNHPKGVSTRKVWEVTNENMTRPISRASVINFLAWAADIGVLKYHEMTGKGGYRRIYSHKHTEEELHQYLKNIVLESLETL